MDVAWTLAKMTCHLAYMSALQFKGVQEIQGIFQYFYFPRKKTGETPCLVSAEQSKAINQGMIKTASIPNLS